MEVVSILCNVLFGVNPEQHGNTDGFLNSPTQSNLNYAVIKWLYSYNDIDIEKSTLSQYNLLNQRIQ